jgi:polysaccharide export outer membrane protein
MKEVRYFLTISLMVLMCSLISFGQTDPTKVGDTTSDKTSSIDKNISNVKTDNEDERYRIGFQDTLEIRVYNHDNLFQRVSINSDGTILLNRATKPITAVCRTEQELAKDIQKDYVSFLKNPVVTVTAIEKKSQSYGVIGSVEKAGTFYASRKIRLLELLAFAGGPNKEAGSRLIVARTGSTSACQLNYEQTADNSKLELLNFKLRDIQEGKQDLWMKPGDIVSVLDADVVYVYGNVNKQGEVKIKEPRTLRQIIASAEGFAKAAQKDKIRVLRQKTDSVEWEEFIYDLKEINSGKVQDPVLLPNDIVAVSEDKVKSILGKVVTSLTGGLGSLPVLVR